MIRFVPVLFLFTASLVLPTTNASADSNSFLLQKGSSVQGVVPSAAVPFVPPLPRAGETLGESEARQLLSEFILTDQTGRYALQGGSQKDESVREQLRLEAQAAQQIAPAVRSSRALQSLLLHHLSPEQEPNPLIRLQVVRALGVMKAGWATMALTKVLHDEDMGEPAVSALTRIASDVTTGKGAVREQAEDALRALELAISSKTGNVYDYPPYVRSAAVRARRALSVQTSDAVAPMAATLR